MAEDKSDTNLELDPELETIYADMETMKERFAKLLLGEDMSGGGKGVSSALALSNAITNLAASAFGEISQLEPMSPDSRARWRKEIDWLLSVSDHIVEFVPSKQNTNGIVMEIMITRQRSDVRGNIPALKKLDGMLMECLDNFKDQNEFSYVSKDDVGSKSNKKREGDKWWLPTPKVPPNGLSELTRKWLHFQKGSANQVLKAAMAMNAHILTEMEIPESYIDALPKNGRASLGDTIYKNITVDHFDPDNFLAAMDLSSEHKILDLKNRIEASVVIWRRKMTNKDGKSGWGSGVSIEKREQFEDRAETILLILKHRYPGISQSALDVSKIENNRDVGHAVLESYSRVLESLAHKVMSRIEDVMHADNLARNPSGDLKRNSLKDSASRASGKFPSAKEDLEKLNYANAPPTSMTLSDFIGWSLEQEKDSKGELSNGNETAKLAKQSSAANSKKLSYIERLETLGGRSPSTRQ
ncbi:rop guanine nucleotide exchange factor 12-like [Bidens hawaiensis]|uniref:rop guanine nucleotide exchange factor 12-like n=1 Tax=Bidens hawaiensis TaxID=980011 RepID=UPI00404A7FD6